MKDINIKGLAFAAVSLTYFLIVFGGYVASSESGMGCGPEWPLCNGKVVPILEGDTLIEFAHRFVGLLLVIISVILYFTIKKSRSGKSLQRTGAWMIGLLAVQVIAGAFVVVLDLPAVIVTLHLIVAMLFLASLLFLFHNIPAFKSRKLPLDNQQIIKQRHLNILVTLSLITIGFGAYIKHKSFGLSCGWWGCGAGWLPMDGAQLLQSFHRLLAIITAVYILYVAFLSFRLAWEKSVQARLLLAGIVVLLQLGSGIFTLVTGIAISWAVLHLAIGTVLFMIIVDTKIIADPETIKMEKEHPHPPLDKVNGA